MHLPLNFSLKGALFLICFGITTVCLSQDEPNRVVSVNGNIPLAGVAIASDDYSTTTNESGQFTVPSNGTYSLQKSGYTSKSVYILANQSTVIRLEAMPESLGEVVINTDNFKRSLNGIAGSVTQISAEQIQLTNTVNIAPIINAVPGVYMHNGTLNTNRITIRGIGSRNLFGTSKIRAYYEDIPLTNGSGASTIEDIELNALGRIEISKGPSSSKYGAGLGGTIQLLPDTGSFNAYSGQASSIIGSFGLQKFTLQAKLGDQNNAGNVLYSNLQSDGFRDNNQTQRQTLTLSTNHFLGDSDRLIIIANYIDLKAYIPSSLNEDDFINNPTAAAFTWGNAQGFEDYTKGLFGVSWEHKFSPNTKQYTSVFTSFLDAYEPRPFNILTEKTTGFGVRSRLNLNHKVLGKTLAWTFGGELFSDKNSFNTYQNLYQDFPEGTGSVQGDLLSDFTERRSYINLFADSQLDLNSRTALQVGFNVNITSYTLTDGFTQDSTDFSGDYSFAAVVSPKIGITHLLSDKAMLYGLISHGFSPPSLEETLLPDGQINPDIKPESGWNFELGSRLELLDKRLQLVAAVYRMDVKNLLVARRTASDQFVGINAGKTRYNGLELEANYKILNTQNITVSTANAFALNDFKFQEFIDLDNDYSGNDLTGVPNLTFNSNLLVETKAGFYALFNYNYVGEIPIRDDNSVYSDSYQIVTAKLGYAFDLVKNLKLDFYGCVNNIFDQKYASMLLINAGSFGNNAPRYYYPGEPVNYYAGANLTYLF